MPIARKSTVILVSVVAAFLIAFIPKHTVADDNGNRIGKLACAPGGIAKFDGLVWGCQPDDDTLAELVCSDGQVAKYNTASTQWECADDDDTDTLAELSCSDGQVAKYNTASTQWECAEDNAGGGPAACLAGFVEVNANVCIEEFERDTSTAWWDANLTCINNNYRLCTVGEWAAACENGSIKEHTNGNWEWTNDASGTAMVTVGYSLCRQSIGVFQPTLTIPAFRCCLDR